VLLSMVVYVMICTITIGLQAVAVAMSDPFGSDDLDFDLETFIKGAYDNSISLIVDQRPAMGDSLPPTMDPDLNPFADNDGAKRLRTWAGLTDASAKPIALSPPQTPTSASKSGSRSNLRYSRLADGGMGA